MSRAQLLAAGIDRDRIARWLAQGRLLPVHRGVYAVGHAAPSVRGDYMAAVLACGPGAVLSHMAAGYLLYIVRGAPPPPEVTIPATAKRSRPGITVHRSALPALDVSELEHIPITIAPRVLLDVAPRLRPKELVRACHEAIVRHETTLEQIDACIARNPHKPGAAKLRCAFASDVTLSVLEDAFLELLAAHDLPRPRTNIDHAGDTVDCHWPDLGLTIELLSYRYHRSKYAFDADLARRRRSTHMAFSYGDVVDRPQRTAAEVRAFIATSAS